MSHNHYGFTIDARGKLDYVGISAGDTFLAAKVVDAKRELWVLHRHGTKFWSGRRDCYANPSCLLVSVVPGDKERPADGRFFYDDIEEIEIKRGETLTSRAAILKLWDRALEIAGQPKRPIEYHPLYAYHKKEKTGAAKAKQSLKETLAAFNAGYVAKGFKRDEFQRFWRKSPRYIFRHEQINGLGMDLAVVFTVENSVVDARCQAACHLRKIREEEESPSDFYTASMEAKRIDVADLAEAQAWAEKLLEFPFEIIIRGGGMPDE